MQPSPGGAGALSSRSLASAQAAAKRAVLVAYGSYEDLIADPERFSSTTLCPTTCTCADLCGRRAGGQDSCARSPWAISAEEAAQLREVADKVLIEEASWCAHHPQWQTARRADPRQGASRPLTACRPRTISYFNVDVANVRNQSDIGGGALYDIGCYAILSGRYLFEAEPLRVVGGWTAIRPSVPTGTSALVDFGGGRHPTFTVSTQNCGFQRVQAIGSQGRIEIPIPFNPPPVAPRIALDSGALDGSRIEVDRHQRASRPVPAAGQAFAPHP